MNYSITFNAGALFRELNNQIKVAMANALMQTARAVQADWQESIYRQRGMYKPYQDRYMTSIKCEVNTGRLTARIYSDDPMAMRIETGIPARDLKRMLNTSDKVRVAKGGKHPGQRYLIIPFRHQTPGYTAHGSDMATDVYRQAMKLTKSTSTLLSMRRSGLNASDVRTKGPMMKMRSSYNWGGRLNGPNIPARQRGMVRMETSSGKQTSSNYFTFRVMTESSNGWIVPAKPGRFIVKGVADRAQELLTFNMRSAIASAAGLWRMTQAEFIDAVEWYSQAGNDERSGWSKSKVDGERFRSPFWESFLRTFNKSPSFNCAIGTGATVWPLCRVFFAHAARLAL